MFGSSSSDATPANRVTVVTRTATTAARNAVQVARRPSPIRVAAFQALIGAARTGLDFADKVVGHYGSWTERQLEPAVEEQKGHGGRLAGAFALVAVSVAGTVAVRRLNVQSLLASVYDRLGVAPDTVGPDDASDQDTLGLRDSRVA